jgi:SAM-dependent methyltransferase
MENLICISCKKKLEEIEGNVCCINCDKNFGSFPILNFVDETYTSSFGFQWNLFQKTQLDSCNNLNLSKKRLFAGTKWKEELKDDLILEVGSGSGRFTEILAKTNANIFTVDSSTAINANYKNNFRFNNVTFIRADINQMPFSVKFDKILCFGVLQHTNNIRNALENLKQYLKSDGELVFDVYKKKWYTFFKWKYILRPLLKKINKQRLLNIVEWSVKLFYYPSLLLFKLFGKVYKNIFPVVYYHEIIKEKKLSIEFSILDTFDMYSPEFDTPLSINELRDILIDLKYKIIFAEFGDNGIVCKVKC